MNKYYMIPNNKDIDTFKEEIILPLKDFSIGFNVYFSAEEIIELSKKRKVNVLINRFLHKEDIESIKDIIKSLDTFVSLFFIEDLGLINMIDKNRIVLYQNHIINNYESVNYFKELGIENIVINNDLTIEELEEIRNKTNSNLFLFGITKQPLMYSRRLLLTSFEEYKNVKSEKSKIITERISKRPLLITEEEKGTIIFNDKILSVNKYIKRLNNYNIVINFTNLSEREAERVKKYYSSEELIDMLEVDDYFLDNKIVYKVGDRK